MSNCSVCGSECGASAQCVICRWSAAPATCLNCGNTLGDDGRCPSCERDRLLELEIDAFTGPAIKRARIWIAVFGVAYLAMGAWNFVQVADARAKIESQRTLIANFLRTEGQHRHAAHHAGRVDKLIEDNPLLREFDPRVQLAKAETRVDTAQWFAVFQLLIGAASLIAAVWAKRKTMAASLGVLALFGIHTIYLLAVEGIVAVTDPVWLVFLVVVVFAVLGGRKAERLRAERRGFAATDPAFAL
jgi:hypothetical protein